MDTTTIVRILLLLFIAFLAWWFLVRRKKYKYQGLEEYVPDTGIIQSFVDHVLQQQGIKKKKKPKRFNKTENKCRKIIEKIYNKEFPSVRPDFLKSPKTGKNLELDCYNDELRVALEYNGAQHYTYNKYFHKSKTDFYSQVHRDDWKRKKCRELGIHLIEVPYWITETRLQEFIIKELKKKNCL